VCSSFCNLYSLQSKVEFVTDITITHNHIHQCLVCSRFKDGRYIQVEQAGVINHNIPLLKMEFYAIIGKEKALDTQYLTDINEYS